MTRDLPDATVVDVDEALVQAWSDHRRRLLDIGFRMLGNLAEAEDAVQEAFIRLARADREQIDDMTGWLVVVVSRICLDALRARGRRPTVRDDLSNQAAMVDPASGAADPADRVTLDDDVRLALQQVLQRLTPAERTAFVLHDVFQYAFDDIAEIVGRTPAACRQLASRARRTITDEDATRSRFRVESAEQRRVTEKFIDACTTGDLDGLLAILDPEVAGVVDVGGRAGTTTVTGATRVAGNVMRFLGPDSGTLLLSLPAGHDAGVVAIQDHRIEAVLSFTLRDGRIDHIDGIVDPSKLTPIGLALGISSTPLGVPGNPPGG